MVFDIPTQKHTIAKTLLEKLTWMSVMDRIEYKRAIMIHKSINGTAPAYIRQMFQFRMDVSQRSTRYIDNFRLYWPTGNHLKVFANSFQYAAGAAWNKLPVQVREVDNTAAFRAAYMKWYISGIGVP